MKKKILIIIPLVALLCMTVFAIFPSASASDDQYIYEKIGDYTFTYSDGSGECFLNLPLSKSYCTIECFLSGTNTKLDLLLCGARVAVSGSSLAMNPNSCFDVSKCDLSSFSEVFLTCDSTEDVSVTIYGKRLKTYDQGYTEGLDVGNANASAKYDEGYRVGENAGYMNGLDKGTKSGYQAGLADGYQNGYDEGKADGLEEQIEQIDGYEYGYNAGYIAGKLDNSSKDQNDKIKDALDDYADAIDSNEGTLVQGFLSGMWNGATNFVQTLLTGITFSGLSLMNIVATGLAILIAVYIIKMVKG